jgi:hypothetical protein
MGHGVKKELNFELYALCPLPFAFIVMPYTLYC